MPEKQPTTPSPMTQTPTEVTYPVAEIFRSVQGEGMWTGTPMVFVRLAGCPVGRYTDSDVGHSVRSNDLPLLQTREHSICTAFEGTSFLCDTNYHTTAKMALLEIMEQIPPRYEHVCITGGEPFIHNLLPLVREIGRRRDRYVHIETSGTLPIQINSVGWVNIWVTCSPKAGFDFDNLNYIDEWKFLVGPHTNMEEILSFVDRIGDDAQENLFLQPINGVHETDEEAVKRVLQLVDQYPAFRLSVQLHKYLGAR